MLVFYPVCWSDTEEHKLSHQDDSKGEFFRSVYSRTFRH